MKHQWNGWENERKNRGESGLGHLPWPGLAWWGGILVGLVVVLGWLPAAWAAPGETAQATLYSTTDEAVVMGLAEMEELSDRLQIQVSFLNAPSGTHGFHIHAEGNCGDGGNAAGGHYNPNDAPHGFLLKDRFANAHAGDLGNAVVREDGTALYTAEIPGLTLSGGSYPVVGHAFIFHANPDDFSQPVGNAGARLACGVIELN